MITFEEVGMMLDDLADELPREFYEGLNGGVILLPGTKLNTEETGIGELIVLGEYHNHRQGYGGMGRYIAIYYGSFVRLYAHLQPGQQKERLRDVLLHEFTHHLESLAGECGLELKDAKMLEEYRQRFNG